MFILAVFFMLTASLFRRIKRKKDYSEFAGKKNEETDFFPRRWLFSDLEELDCY